jgi:anti-sigma regulatory factor (Ser/Thr protein kinase)
VQLDAKLSLALPGAPETTTVARKAIRALEIWCDRPCGEDLALLTSEVVTNAVKHGPIPIENNVSLEALVFDDVIRVEVQDSGAGFDPPIPGPPDEPRPSGWGLLLVEELARRWGVESLPSSTVWFEVARRATESRSAT